jgi:hypothetical protein
MATKKINIKKAKKLSKIPVITRRIFKLWSEAVRSSVGHKCEYCGIERGTLNASGKPTKIDAHHLMNRDVKDCPLKFDMRNGISLCPSCHKFCPNNGFHTNPIRTVHWLKENQPHKYDFVLKNSDLQINLMNRTILAIIEESVKNGKELDLDLLVKIDEKYHADLFDSELAKSLAEQYS